MWQILLLTLLSTIQAMTPNDNAEDLVCRYTEALSTKEKELFKTVHTDPVYQIACNQTYKFSLEKVYGYALSWDNGTDFDSLIGDVTLNGNGDKMVFDWHWPQIRNFTVEAVFEDGFWKIKSQTVKGLRCAKEPETYNSYFF